MIIAYCVIVGVCIAGGFVAKTIMEDQADHLASNEVKIAELLTELNAAHDKLVAIADLTSPYHDEY